MQEVWGNPWWLISQEHQPIYSTDSDVARETGVTRDSPGTNPRGPIPLLRGRSRSHCGWEAGKDIEWGRDVLMVQGQRAQSLNWAVAGEGSECRFSREGQYSLSY